MTINTIQVQSCPCCGSSAMFAHDHCAVHGAAVMRGLVCTGCGLQIRLDQFQSVHHMVAAWNRRAGKQHMSELPLVAVPIAQPVKPFATSLEDKIFQPSLN